MALLDDILGPSAAMLGPQGVQGTASVQSQPKPKKKTQQTPQTPLVAKTQAPPVDLSDNPFAQPAPTASSTPDLSGNPFAEAGTSGDAAVQKAHADFKSGALPRHEAALNAVDRGNAQAASDADTYANRLGSMLEAPLSGVPGGALAMSAARKLTNGGTLAENQDAINRETDTARLSTPLKLVGGLASTALVPAGASSAAAGAGLAAADQALNNDPNSGVVNRALRTAGGAVVGHYMGQLLDNVLTGARAGMTPNPSEEISALKSARSAADASPIGPSYATTAQQVAKGPWTSPALQDALEHPGIAPYVNRVQASEIGQGMTDAEVAQEAYKMMSEAQGKKIALGHSGDFQAGTDFDMRNLGALKAKLKDAIATVAPDFPEAVATHAEMSQPITATRQGADAARQLMADRALAARNLDIPAKDPQAFLRQTVPNMTPEQSLAAMRGALGQLKGTFQPSVNPLKLFGAAPYLSNAGTVSPLVRALDEQSGGRAMDALRQAIMSYGQSRVATP